MMTINVILGRIRYNIIGAHLPVAHCLIKPLGRFSKCVRQLCGKMILTRCGDNVNIYPKSSFSSKVELGNNSDIGLRCRLNGKVIIGNDVIMGPDVLVYTQNHNTSRSDIPIKYQGVTEEKSVTIGDGCWICSRVIILPGVHIGKNSVIGAGSVVTKDIPDYAIAAGNPAKVVRIRDGVHKDNAY